MYIVTHRYRFILKAFTEGRVHRFYVLILDETRRAGEDAEGYLALACSRLQTELEQHLEQLRPRLVCEAQVSLAALRSRLDMG